MRQLLSSQKLLKFQKLCQFEQFSQNLRERVCSKWKVSLCFPFKSFQKNGFNQNGCNQSGLAFLEKQNKKFKRIDYASEALGVDARVVVIFVEKHSQM